MKDWISILRLLLIGSFLLAVFSSDALGSSTNEYWDSTNAGCTPGSVQGWCSQDQCVACNGECVSSNAFDGSGDWVCYNGKWDKCDPESQGVTRGKWLCKDGKWVPVYRTNEYWDSTNAGCTPGSVQGWCSQDQCVVCNGDCVSSNAFDGSGDWVCYNGKWDKCDLESQGVTRGKWLCKDGKWVPLPENYPSYDSLFDYVVGDITYDDPCNKSITVHCAVIEGTLYCGKEGETMRNCGPCDLPEFDETTVTIYGPPEYRSPEYRPTSDSDCYSECFNERYMESIVGVSPKAESYCKATCAETLPEKIFWVAFYNLT